MFLINNWSVVLNVAAERGVHPDDAAPVEAALKAQVRVWTQARAVEELGDVVRAHPGIGWVQLPMAGVERVAEAGLLDSKRQWTSAKGAYAEPVAEHALALLLAGLPHGGTQR